MSKTNIALEVAFERFGRALLGPWCIVGPITLIFASSDFELALFVFLLAMIFFFYAIAITKCWKQGNAWLRLVLIDSLFFLLFAGIGTFITSFIAAFGGPAHGALTLGWGLIGFWILEMRKPDPQLKQS